MSTVLVVVIVIIVIAVAGAVGFLLISQSRHRRLQAKFGPEYDRAVQSHDSTREAEQDLLARQKRHDELDIKELDPETRERHRAEWQELQERFVDAPESAVTEADRLLILVMGERGYPTEGYEQQVDDLSVEHAGTIGRYRTAHEIGTRAEAKQASTEDLRQAMVHYRTLFTELLGDTRTRKQDATPSTGTHAGAGGRDANAGTRAAADRDVNTGAETTADRDVNTETDAGAGTTAHREVNAKANGGRTGGAESGTQAGERAGRREDAGDEGAQR